MSKFAPCSWGFQSRIECKDMLQGQGKISLCFMTKPCGGWGGEGLGTGHVAPHQIYLISCEVSPMSRDHTERQAQSKVVMGTMFLASAPNRGVPPPPPSISSPSLIFSGRMHIQYLSWTSCFSLCPKYKHYPRDIKDEGLIPGENTSI